MQISREYFQLMHPRENINIKLVFSKIGSAKMGSVPGKLFPQKLSFHLDCHAHKNKNGTHSSTSEKGEYQLEI